MNIANDRRLNNIGIQMNRKDLNKTVRAYDDFELKKTLWPPRFYLKNQRFKG